MSVGGREQHLIYSIRNPLLDDVRIEMRHSKGGRIEQFQMGDMPIREKMISHALDPVLAFQVQSDEQLEVLMSVRTTNFMTLGMWLADHDTYSDHGQLWRGRALS